MIILYHANQTPQAFMRAGIAGSVSEILYIT
jgi:hypothetical protein